MMSMIRSESFEKSVELSVEEARKHYAILKQRAKDKLESVRWPKSDGEVKSPSPSIPDLTVSENIEYRMIKSPLGMDTDDSDTDGAVACTMDMASDDDQSNVRMVGSEMTTGKPYSTREVTSPNAEGGDAPLGYRSFVKTPALERSVEEARKQYMILKQRAKDKLDSIRMPKAGDDTKLISPIHVPMDQPTNGSSPGTYKPQTGKVMEPTKDLQGLQMDGHFDQTEKMAGHQHVPSISGSHLEPINKIRGRYTHASSSRTELLLEKEKIRQEIVKLGEEAQYYRGRQRLFDDEIELIKLKKEKLRIEIEILEKQLLGYIKKVQY